MYYHLLTSSHPFPSPPSHTTQECGLPGALLLGLAVSAEDTRKAVQGIKSFCSKYCRWVIIIIIIIIIIVQQVALTIYHWNVLFQLYSCYKLWTLVGELIVSDYIRVPINKWLQDISVL